jgi:hypothetical protein
MQHRRGVTTHPCDKPWFLCSQQALFVCFVALTSSHTTGFFDLESIHAFRCAAAAGSLHTGSIALSGTVPLHAKALNHSTYEIPAVAAVMQQRCLRQQALEQAWSY